MKIFNNWPIKVLSVVIAIFFWIFISVSGNKTDFFPGELQITTRNLPAQWAAVYDNYTARVKISASANTWAKLSSDNFIVYLDVSNKGLGTYEIAPKVEVTQAGVEIVSINPEKVRVHIEQAVSSKLSVAIRFSGQPAQGFEINSAKIEPNKIDAWGAKSVLEKLIQATVLVKLNGEDRDIEKQIRITALDENDKEIPLIRFDPERVLLNVSLARKGGGKIVGIKPKIIGSPAAGYWMNGISFSPQYVKVKGSEQVLSKTEFLETGDINIDNLNSSQKFKTKLILPKELSLVDRDQNLVEVEIKLSAISQAKEVQASIAYDKLAEDLKIADINPKSVTVVLSGPPSILNYLNSESVVINLNMANYKSGNHAITITQDNISFPNDLSLVSFVPNVINVRIEGK